MYKIRLMQGSGQDLRLILLRDQLSIRSLEVARLTHLFSENLNEQFFFMRNSIQFGVEIMGGTYFRDVSPRYPAKDVLNDKHVRPIVALMTRKRDIGIALTAVIVVVRLFVKSHHLSCELRRKAVSRNSMARVILLRSLWLS